MRVLNRDKDYVSSVNYLQTTHLLLPFEVEFKKSLRSEMVIILTPSLVVSAEWFLDVNNTPSVFRGAQVLDTDHDKRGTY